MIKYLNRDHIALLLCLTLSLFLYFSSSSSIVLSVKAEISDIFSILKYPQKWYSGLLITEEENKLLKQKLIRLNLLNSQLIKYEKEIDELKKLLNFYEEQPFSMKIGKIINDNSSYLMRALTINLGKNDSVDINLPVLDIDGLFGKIYTAGDNASQIQLINDKNFRLSIRVGEDLSLGEFIPTHKNLGVLDGIIKTAKVEIGDIVYTSGISTIYPELLPVARVLSVTSNSDKGFQDIVVEILSDLNNYNYIFVVL